MAGREYHERWTWDLEATPEQLWPLVADTNRFDRDSGVPAANLLDADELLGTGRARVRVRQYGVALDYVQDPFEWDEPRRFSVTRHFSTGPIGRLRILAELEPREVGGTRLTYQVWATRRNALGFSIPIQIGLILRGRFERAFRTFDRLAIDGEPDRPTGPRPRLARGATARIEAIRAARASVPGGERVDPALLDRLAEHVLQSDDVAVARMRPYALADRWGRDRREVLEAALVATRLGLLRFRWDVLCPSCRISKGTGAHLGDLPTAVHCETCLVDTTANFAENVELTFSPVTGIRHVDPDEYCIGNPTATPHVVNQRLVEPGSQTVVTPPRAGRYRVRAIEGSRPIDAAQVVTVDDGGTIVLRNDEDVERVMVVEQPTWGADAVTGAEVTALQRFRDLFADEALRPGERIDVGTMTVAFTDLCDSTALYRRIGDAVAFGRVLEHFDVLTDCVDAEGGSIVKTIGDAVMAVFGNPEAAVAAMLEAQRRVRLLDPDGILRLKAGVHTGPCIAVTLNDRLDYFGSTVNLAARLEGCATGDDVVVSEAVFRDARVVGVLDDDRLAVEELRTTLKGFDGPHQVWRLTPAAAPSSGSTT